MAGDLPPRLLELIDLTYAAVEEPDSWRTLMRRLMAQFPGIAISLVLRPRSNWDEPMWLEEGYPYGSMDQYVAEYDAAGPWNVIEIRSAVGVAYTVEEFVPFAELQTTDFYRNWCVPYGLGSGFGVKLFDDADSFGSILIDCSPTLSPAYERDIKQTLNVLAPHVRRALRLATSQRRVRQSAISDLVASKRAAALVIDADLILSAANQAAERVRELGWCKWPAIGGPFTLRTAADTDRLKTILRALVMDAGAGKHRSQFLPVLDETEEDMVVLDVTPLQTEVHRDGEAGGLIPAERRTCFLVRVRVYSELPLPSPEDLTTAFGLSDLEAQAVIALIGGQTIEQQAVARHVTSDAIRWHFRNIYQKIGCKTQVELARVVLGLLQR